MTEHELALNLWHLLGPQRKSGLEDLSQNTSESQQLLQESAHVSQDQ